MDDQGNAAATNMEATAGQPQRGTIIRGADGALYFIRDEMWESFRLPEKLAQDAEMLLNQGSMQGINVNTEAAFNPLARVEGEEVTAHTMKVEAVASTVMCPSFLFGR